MSWIKTALKKIGEAFGHLFGGLYKEAEIVYENLPVETQLSLQHGSGILAVINGELKSAPGVVRAKVIKLFPDIDEPKMEQGLFDVAKKLGLGGFNDFDDVVVSLQSYLSKQQGAAWEWVSFSASSALALAFAPAGTKLAVVTNLLETVYEKIIKPLIEAKLKAA